LGIALLVVGESDVTKVIGAISAAAGSVGITWRSLASRVGKVAADVESHLWGAELDVAVAVAITRGPDGWGQEPSDLARKLPAAGEEPQATADLMVISQFQTALEKNRLAKPRDALLVARRLTPNTQRLPDVLNANAPTAEELLHPYARFTPRAGVYEPIHIQGRTNVVAWLA
jgi:hypothetical protein